MVGPSESPQPHDQRKMEEYLINLNKCEDVKWSATVQTFLLKGYIETQCVIAGYI